MIYIVEYDVRFENGVENFVGSYYTADTDLNDAARSFIEELKHYLRSNDIDYADFLSGANDGGNMEVDYHVEIHETVPPKMRPEWDQIYFNHTGRHLHEEDQSNERLVQSYIELERKGLSCGYDCRIESMLFVLGIVHWLYIWEDFSFITIEKHVVQNYGENMQYMRTFRDYISDKNEFMSIPVGSIVTIKGNEVHGEYKVKDSPHDSPCMIVPHWENFRYICNDDSIALSHYNLICI